MIAWQRDATDPFALHVQVPGDVSAIDIELQHLTPLDSHAGRVVMTREMLNLQWNNMLLYPAGYASPRIVFPGQRSPAHRLAANQRFACAADYRRPGELRPRLARDLVDSPVFAGRHVRRVVLDSSGAKRPVAA